MIKVILLSLFLFSSLAYANSPDCNRNLTSIFTNSDLETLGATDCSKLQRRQQESFSCDCITTYNQTYSVPVPNSLTESSFEDLKNRAKDEIEKSFLSLSLDIVAASHNSYIAGEDISNSCSIDDKLANTTCEAGNNSLYPSGQRAELALKMKNEIKNGFLNTSPYSAPAFVTREDNPTCLIPDNAIARINHETQVLSIAPIVALFRNSSEAQLSENLLDGLEAIQRNATDEDFEKLEVFQEARKLNPILRNLMESNEFMTELRDSNFNPEVAKTLLNGEANATQTLNSIKNRCDQAFENMNQVLCASSPNELLHDNFADFRLRLLEDQSPQEDVDDLIAVNQDISFYCSNRDSFRENSLYSEINSITAPHLSRAPSASIAAHNDYDYRINTSKNAENVQNGISLCDFVPNPGNRDTRRDIREAFRSNCGQTLSDSFELQQIEGEDSNKLFSYNCQTTLAVWKIYGEQIKHLEALEGAIELAQASEPSAGVARTVNYNGAQIPITQAVELRNNTIDNFFKQEQRIPNIVASYIGAEEQRPTALAVNAPTPGQPATATGAVTPQVQSQTAATQGSQSNRARSFTSGSAQVNLDSDAESNARISGNYQQSNPNQVEENMNDFYSEFASRLRANNDQDIARMQNEVQELSSQVAGSNQGRTARARSRLTPTLEAAIDNPGARELFASSAPSDVNQNGFAPQISQSSVSANDAPDDIVESVRAEENNALNSRNRALSRAAAAGSNATSRGPASVGAASNGGGSLSITPASSNTTPLDAGNAIAQINIENDANLDTALVNIAEQNPAVARQLLDLLQNDQVRSFYITNNDYRVLINKRNGEFVVRSEGNEADPGYINFLTSVRQSVQIQSNFENLISQLTAIN